MVTLMLGESELTQRSTITPTSPADIHQRSEYREMIGIIVDSVSRVSQFFNETQMIDAQADIKAGDNAPTRLAAALNVNALFALFK